MRIIFIAIFFCSVLCCQVCCQHEAENGTETEELEVRTGRDSLDMRWEFQRYDGWFNNLAHPSWGSTGKSFHLIFICLLSKFLTRTRPSADSQLTRKAPSAYLDGVYMMPGSDRPSPRALSQIAMKGDDGKQSGRNLTGIFAFFGKFFNGIDHLIDSHTSQIGENLLLRTCNESE